MSHRLCLIALIIVLINIYVANVCSATQEFHIDFDKNTFVKDGQPFRYVSGSIHPYRVPRSLWQDRLSKMRAAGLNAIQIYIFWNEHEPYPGVYDFSGKNDIYTFVKMAQSTGLLVILRVGPYACAEHEFGGLPWWLMSDRKNPIIGRSSDPRFIKAVHQFYSVFFPPIVPLLYNNGGPVIMVQIENEYGGFGCDQNYLLQLREIFRSYLGDDVVYFTTDNDVDYCVKCGKIPGVYSTVDFGPWDNATRAFAIQRMVAPNGPLVCSEYYVGWIDTWGTNHTRTDADFVVKLFVEVLEMGGSLNFYMFHGGTNFGFSNGAVHPYVPVITSYDYDAPISEAGDVTNKFMKIRQAISNYLPIPPGPIPANSTKYAYGKVKLEYWTSLSDAIVENSDRCVQSQYPLSFEELGQGHGFILYSTTLNTTDLFGKVLNISNVGDRAYVQIGTQSIGIIQRHSNITSITIDLKDIQDPTLTIIVENQGHLNVEPIDPKGLLSNVTLNGQILQFWTTCLTDNFVPYYQQPVNPKDKNKPHPFSTIETSQRFKDPSNVNFTAPAIYIGTWSTGKTVYETFLKTDQFSKGVAFISSASAVTNLGRYWSSLGPQHTLYVPTEFVTPSYGNTIVLIEFDNGSLCNNPDDCYVEFVDHMILD